MRPDQPVFRLGIEVIKSIDSLADITGVSFVSRKDLRVVSSIG